MTNSYFMAFMTLNQCRKNN